MDRLSDYTYDLPDELIAQEPLADREASRLLHLPRQDGPVVHRRFQEVPDLLQPGDVLVVNRTRVTAVRLFGRRPSGGAVETLILRSVGPNRMEALVRPAKRLRVGERIEFEEGLDAMITEIGEDGVRILEFSGEDIERRLAKVGQLPLPPYIHGYTGESERYQTVFAEEGGSAAAPTAGLHFTKELLERIRARGVTIAPIVLDVGIDTFRPILTDDLSEHRMHGERCEIPETTAQAIASAEGRIIAVGTTAVRTLESLAIGPRRVRSGEMETRLFIRPGYEFQIVDGMFTNFHLPGTTMMLMISAMAGRERVLDAYRDAVRERYRFLSFGDSMLIL